MTNALTQRLPGIAMLFFVCNWGLAHAGATAKCVVRDFYAQVEQKRDPVVVDYAVHVTSLPASIVQFPVAARAAAPNLSADERRVWELRQAARMGDLPTFKALLPGAKEERNRILRKHFLLHTAFEYGSVEIVRQIMIVDPGALPALTQKGGVWVLTAVVDGWSRSVGDRQRGAALSPREQSYVYLARQLLASGLLKDGPEEWGKALVAIASIPQATEVNELAAEILSHGAPIDARGPQQRTALSLASEARNPALVRQMLATKAPSQDVLDEAIVWAPIYDNAESLKLLLERGANLNVDGAKFGKGTTWYPANDAAAAFKFSGVREPIALFIQYKVDPNRNRAAGTSALMRVMHDQELMKGLLELGANVNAQDSEGNTALHIATQIPKEIRRNEGDSRAPEQIAPGIVPEMRRKSVALLLQYGADPRIANRDGVTPLMQTTSEDGETVKLLAAKGGTINLTQYAAFYNQPGYGSKTGPVSAALLHNNDALALVLLSRESTISPEDCGAVYYAAQVGGTRTLAALLDRKVDVYAATNDEGMTPFHVAAASGQTEVVKLFLDRRSADINESTPFAVTSCGGHGPSVPCVRGRKTALMFAAKGNHLAVAEELIRRGASVNRLDYSGDTALKYASQASEEMVKLLKSHGAR